MKPKQPSRFCVRDPESTLPGSSQAAGPPGGRRPVAGPPGRPRHGLVPAPARRLHLSRPRRPRRGSGAPGPPQPRRDPLCRALATAGSKAWEGPAPRHQRRRLEPRTAPPVPGLRESYRGVLARHQNPDPSYPPRESLSPVADSPSPNGFPEPTAANTSAAASQNGRPPARPLGVPGGGGARCRRHPVGRAGALRP